MILHLILSHNMELGQRLEIGNPDSVSHDILARKPHQPAQQEATKADQGLLYLNLHHISLTLD